MCCLLQLVLLMPCAWFQGMECPTELKWRRKWMDSYDSEVKLIQDDKYYFM
ncbi:hypothetical protein Pyn_01846 [Prunus yedoensis var. nudiflora]|uniref:Uncharacterized protein n=1 Tax=Prunus yedoensis var. nudiflora TaxID=2094558 RepID=A0A314UQL6_PRUYE|nr:hypothetical protein Pyn_01846 [Prunus yedoensis var. nudiflora]